MLFRKEIFNDGTILGIWKIEESKDDLLSLFDNCKEGLIAELNRFQNDKRKIEFLATRALIKELLGYENMVCYDENGKPSLVDNLLKISISHTLMYVSVIISPKMAVGVDIEQKRDKILRLSNRFLSKSELNNIDKKRELEHLLLHWSAKETMFKMMGETDVDFIESMHVLPFLPANEGEFFSFETKSKKKQKFNMKYIIHKDFILVWCTSTIN